MLTSLELKEIDDLILNFGSNSRVTLSVNDKSLRASILEHVKHEIVIDLSHVKGNAVLYDPKIKKIFDITSNSIILESDIDVAYLIYSAIRSSIESVTYGGHEVEFYETVAKRLMETYND